MANKRSFKKYVSALGANVCDDMITDFYNVDGIDRAKVEEAVSKVGKAVFDARRHANVFFDKGIKAFENHQDYSKAKAEFFKKMFDKIYTDFMAGMNDAVKEFNSALPEDVKKHNKAVANAQKV